MICRVLLLFALYLPISLSMSVATASTVLLNERPIVKLSAEQAEAFEDESAKLKLQQVLSPSILAQFKLVQDDELNFGQTESAIWLRFTLRNESTEKWYLLVDAMLGADFDVYIFPKAFEPDAAPQLLDGQKVKRLENYRRPARSLDIPRNQDFWVYIRATNGDSLLLLPVEFLTADKMLKNSNWAYVFFGAIYAAMIVLAIYQFVNAIKLRDLASATLGVFILAMTVAFHRSSPAYSPLFFLGSTTAHFSTAAISIMVAAFTAFSRQFLETARSVPRVDWLFKGVIALALVMVFVIGFIDGGKKYTIALGLFILLLIFFTSIYLGCQGNALARRFAWVFTIPLLAQVPNTIIMIMEIGHWKWLQDIAVVVSTLIFMFFIVAMQAERVRTMRENMQKNEVKALITNKLSKFVGPDVYREIYEGNIDAKLETHSKDLTIFFSDIVDFTQTSEQMQIDELAIWLNGYLNEMTQIALSRKGSIDKFIGDAVMIFFGDSQSAGKKQDAINCVRMAMAMQKKAKSLGIEIRIGINSGRTTVGNFGAEARMDYTVVGRSVNLAARLEKLAKPGTILVSEATYQLVKSVLPCEERETIMVKGFAYPVKTYWVVQSQ